MKNLILLLLLPFMSYQQTYPVIQEFDPPLAWTVTNGAGIQNYGLPENYLTTNMGNTPYPNSSTILMISPITSYANCGSLLSVSFPLSGIIESGWDFMNFQYSINGGGSWVNVATYTGNQNTTYTYNIPNTANRFRFRLVTDNTVNTYGPPGNPSVYYYDIARFTINCAIPLPVEISYFKGYNSDNGNILEWKTLSEIDNNYFELYNSTDGEAWNNIGHINGNNTSTGYTYFTVDYNYKNVINYYKLVQTSINGIKQEYNIISIDNSVEDKDIVEVVNSLGQIVDINTSGLVIIRYSDGSIKKQLN